MNAVELNTTLYKILSKNVELINYLNGGKIYKDGFRPENSNHIDIVVNTLSVNHQTPQLGLSNINIYVSDKIVKIGNVENYTPDSVKISTIVNLVFQALENGLRDYDFADVGWFVVEEKTFKNDSKTPEHYHNIRVQFIIN